MITTDINADLSVATIRDDNDKTILTVITSPLSEIDATPATRFIPALGVSNEAALKQISEVIVQSVNPDNFIHLDLSDYIQTCAGKSIHIVQFNVGNNPDQAFLGALETQNLTPELCDSALISVSAHSDISMSEASSLVNVVSEKLPSDATIIWGLKLEPQQKETMLTVILTEREQ